MTFNFVTYLGYIALAGLCIQLGDYLDKNPNIVNEILTTILNKGKTCNIRASCEIFIKSFDLIYVNNFKYTLVSYILWIWIFVTWGIVFYFEIFVSLMGEYIDTSEYIRTTPILWASSIFGSAMFIFLVLPIISFHLSMPGYNYLFDELKLIYKKEKKLTDYMYGENKLCHVPILNHTYNLVLLIKNLRNVKNNTTIENYHSRNSLLKGLFMSVYVAARAGIFILAMGAFIRIPFNEYILTSSGYPDLRLFHMGYLEFVSIMCILSFFMFIIIFIPSICMYVFFSLMEKYRLASRFSPIVVILSSIVAIFIVSIIKLDLITPFITSRQKFIYEFAPLFFLNIIADSLSIVETRYMLRKAVSGTSVKLILYLVLDFLASSLIYLSIPILNGDLRYFLDAISFNGKMAWVGIFYWSSLSTSLFLYIYVISFFILTLLYKFSNIKHIAERPSYSLGWITAIIFVIIYPIYVWSGIIVSHILPIIALLLLFFLITLVIKKARTE